MKTLKVVWVVEEFDSGEWSADGLYDSRSDAREQAARIRQLYKSRARVVRYIRSEA